MMASDYSGWMTLSSSNESGQWTYKATSNESRWQTCWEQVVDEASKQREQDKCSAAAANDHNNDDLLNSLTAIRVLVGTKNSRPVGFYSRNSMKVP